MNVSKLVVTHLQSSFSESKPLLASLKDDQNLLMMVRGIHVSKPGALTVHCVVPIESRERSSASNPVIDNSLHRHRLAFCFLNACPSFPPPRSSLPFPQSSLTKSLLSTMQKWKSFNLGELNFQATDRRALLCEKISCPKFTTFSFQSATTNKYHLWS